MRSDELYAGTVYLPLIIDRTVGISRTAEKRDPSHKRGAVRRRIHGGRHARHLNTAVYPFAFCDSFYIFRKIFARRVESIIRPTPRYPKDIGNFCEVLFIPRRQARSVPPLITVYSVFTAASFSLTAGRSVYCNSAFPISVKRICFLIISSVSPLFLRCKLTFVTSNIFQSI